MLRVSLPAEVDSMIKQYAETGYKGFRDFIAAHVYHKVAIVYTGLSYFNKHLAEELGDVQGSVLVLVLESLKETEKGLLKAEKPSNYLDMMIKNAIMEYLRKKWTYEFQIDYNYTELPGFGTEILDCNRLFVTRFIQDYSPSIYFDNKQEVAEDVIVYLKQDPYLQITVEERLSLRKKHKIALSSLRFFINFYVEDIKRYFEQKFVGAYV